jgi:hypothetical protein
MLDISQATNMLTSLGVTSTLAAKTAERTAQKHADADPLTFLKELQATLEQLSTETAQGRTAGTTAATTTAGQTKPYQPTAALYSESAEETGTTQSAATAPFSNLEEFRKWESGLGDTLAADYEPPDYVRVILNSRPTTRPSAAANFRSFRLTAPRW